LAYPAYPQAFGAFPSLYSNREYITLIATFSGKCYSRRIVAIPIYRITPLTNFVDQVIRVRDEWHAADDGPSQ